MFVTKITSGAFLGIFRRTCHRMSDTVLELVKHLSKASMVELNEYYGWFKDPCDQVISAAAGCVTLRDSPG